MRDGILHNPRCSKSRETLALLRAHGVELPVIDYLQQPPNLDELRELCSLLGLRPAQLVRRKEALFAELALAAIDEADDGRWLAVLAQHPKLIERPIVVHRGRAALGRPPEAVLGLL